MKTSRRYAVLMGVIALLCCTFLFMQEALANGDAVSVCTGTGIVESYTDFSQALENCGNGQYIQLLQDVQVDVRLSRDLYIDLNGHCIEGMIETGKYTIYGMDSATNGYGSSDAYMDCTNADGSALELDTVFRTTAEMTGDVRSYMAIEGDNGWSFHRFYLGITHVTLKTATTGMGFKAEFRANDAVMRQLDETKAFGYTLQLGEYAPVSVWKPVSGLVSGSTVTMRVDHWDLDAFGETPLSAQVYIKLADGTKLCSEESTQTFRQAVTAVDVNYKSYASHQLKGVVDLIHANPVILKWNLKNLVSYQAAETPAAGTVYKLGMNVLPLGDSCYYMTGQMSGNYFAVSTDSAAAPDVYLEAVTGGYQMYFMNGTTKTYINIQQSGSTSKAYAEFVAEGAGTPTVYTFNTQYRYMQTEGTGYNFYLGTYTSSYGTTYQTISASSTYYISDTSKIGVSQFPAWLYAPQPIDIEVEEETPVQPDTPCQGHVDADNNGFCDLCQTSVTVSFDIYAVNDLHGKFADSDANIGVDELTTYLRNAQNSKKNVILLSSGDMWQGSSESNLTEGLIITDWMNDLGFASMTLGNHEYDWGEEIIAKNQAAAQFPFLAINIYDRQTKAQVEYCQSSVVVEADGLQIGIIGAVGDCYSSISSDQTQDIYFITGSSLTSLVKAEAQRLRSEGVDFVIYSIHDGYSSGGSGTSATSVSSLGYYDTSLSNGYIDLVFEAHTHQKYLLKDQYGVYHVQAGGDNAQGISYASVTINTVNGNSQVTGSQVIPTSTYATMEDDPIVQELLDKYAEQIAIANKVLGYNSVQRNSTQLRQMVAQLYLRAGLEKWSADYDIVLGGGYLSCRSPYYLYAGDVTYGMLQTLFPFDNDIVLCSIKGQSLLDKFLKTTNSNYFISCSEYGEQIQSSIDPNGIYYVVVDTYSAYYTYNNLTIVEEYDPGVYARDLLAEYIEAGNLEK